MKVGEDANDFFDIELCGSNALNLVILTSFCGGLIK